MVPPHQHHVLVVALDPDAARTTAEAVGGRAEVCDVTDADAVTTVLAVLASAMLLT